jgi:hypothetical protein
MRRVHQHRLSSGAKHSFDSLCPGRVCDLNDGTKWLRRHAFSGEHFEQVASLSPQPKAAPPRVGKTALDLF